MSAAAAKQQWGEAPADRRRVPAEARKSERLSIVTTRAIRDKLARVAALAGVSQSELAHDCLVRGLDGMDGVSDAQIEEVEAQQDDWRRSRGLA